MPTLRLPHLLLTALSLLVTALGAQAQPADRDARFAGEWVGTFECDGTGEHGVLVVRFGTNDGFGGGLFFVPGPYPDELFPEQVPLAFDRLAFQGRAFSAALVRYDEDEWAVPLATTIRGALVADDRLEGRLAATGAINETIPQCGRWWASRVSPNAPVAVP